MGSTKLTNKNIQIFKKAEWDRFIKTLGWSASRQPALIWGAFDVGGTEFECIEKP